MNNWQRHLAEDNMYGLSFFPVHSVVDSVYGYRSRDHIDASEQRVTESVAYAEEAIRSLFSPQSDRSAN